MRRHTGFGGAGALKDLPGVRGALPGFGEVLADQEIWNVLAFINTHWPDAMRGHQPIATENAK